LFYFSRSLPAPLPAFFQILLLHFFSLRTHNYRQRTLILFLGSIFTCTSVYNWQVQILIDSHSIFFHVYIQGWFFFSGFRLYCFAFELGFWLTFFVMLWF
jgi:hypothetical protein